MFRNDSNSTKNSAIWLRTVVQVSRNHRCSTSAIVSRRKRAAPWPHLVDRWLVEQPPDPRHEPTDPVADPDRERLAPEDQREHAYRDAEAR